MRVRCITLLGQVADFKKATGEAEGDGFELKRFACWRPSGYELSASLSKATPAASPAHSTCREPRLAYELSERQRLEAERESQEAERAESDKKVGRCARLVTGCPRSIS